MGEETPSRRTFLQVAAVTAATGLAGCEADDATLGDSGGNESEDGDQRRPEGPVGEYLAIQERLGDALAAVVETNRELREAELVLRHMAMGLMVDGDLDVLLDAPFPAGLDREAFFDPPEELFEDGPVPNPVRDPSEPFREPETEEASARAELLRDLAPADVDEWADVVERFDDGRAELDRRHGAVVEAVDELRAHLEENGEEFVAGAEGTTTVEVHPQFADGAVPLLDSLLSIHFRTTDFRGDVAEFQGPELDWLWEFLERECDYECVEASVSVVVGPAESLPTDHAWLKYEKTYERACQHLEEDSYTDTTELGFTVPPRPIRDDSGREVTCERHVWTGDCDDPRYEEFEEELVDDLTGPGIPWNPWYNCLNWALDVAEHADQERADELREEAKSSWNGIIYPSELC